MTSKDHNGGQQPGRLQGRADEHIDETNLILYLDHELLPEDSARVSSHLERCAQCRQLEAELAEACAAFSSLQREFDQTLPAPPADWAAFKQHLVGVLAEQSEPREPWPKGARNVWRKWTPGAPILPWGLATAAAGLLLGYLWLHYPATPTFSINDIVKRVEQKSNALPSSLRPVVYRKLRISVSTAPNVPVTVELWKRTSDGRVKELDASQPVGGPVGRPAKQSVGSAVSGAIGNAAPDSDSGLLEQINELYVANHLDWSEPLSATEFKRWTDADGPKQEQVVQETLPGGGESYRLIARAKNPLTSPRHEVLSEMQLLVRSSDWHAVAERLTVQAPTGVRSYEVAELDYRELPINEVPASIFEAISVGTGLASDIPHSALGTQPLSGVALTVDVLKRLDTLDALVKDQVKVTRVGAEGLKLEGTIVSDQRKAEILAALGPVASNPALELDLVSPSEARDRASRSGGRPLQVQSIQLPPSSQVSNAFLRDWLAHHRGTSGSELDAEAERFQMEAVGLSADAQLQAQALQRILTVVPAAPGDGEIAEKWRSLVNRHAQAVQEKVRALEQQLAPVFRTANTPAPADGSESYKLEGLKPEADRLVDVVTASDRALWQAFSRNATDSDQRQLTDPKFWLMLEEEASMAAHLMQEAVP